MVWSGMVWWLASRISRSYRWALVTLVPSKVQRRVPLNNLRRAASSSSPLVLVVSGLVDISTGNLPLPVLSLYTSYWAQVTTRAIIDKQQAVAHCGAALPPTLHSGKSNGLQTSQLRSQRPFFNGIEQIQLQVHQV